MSEILETYECEFCSKKFTQKYNLNSHKKTAKYCLEIQGKNNENFKCEMCNKHFTTKFTLNDHMKACKSIYKKYKEDTEKYKEDYYKQEIEKQRCIIEEKDNQIRSLNAMIENLNSTIKELAEKAIDRPTIKNQNNLNNFQTILTDSKIYDENTEHNRVLDIARIKMEDYFWKGQKGIAQFCLDHIVKTNDGKMILCCTDPSRKRFKFVNADGQFKDDIEARIFTQKISVPIKIVCEEVFKDITKKIDDDKSHDNGFLDIKKGIAMEKLIEINDIDDNEKNSDYKNELSLLLKSL